PAGTSSNYLEGIFGCYGIVLFIPIYWELSRQLSLSRKILARVTYITGLLGPATGFTHMYGRIYEYELRLHGAGDAVWQSFYTNPGGELLSVALLGPLFPLTSLLLGIGFIATKRLPVWMCLAMIVAGVLFPAAMITADAALLNTAYPAACALWLISFWTYGIKYYFAPKPAL
ncbi:MAG TPA: hypothetical protein VD996_04475, partial [Chitinophagaceae bacterium]|nr:hypothetical protein [Chitinophagaceae bacterium]